MIVTALVYLSISIIAGLMVGVLGIGGGLVIIPGLLFIFQTHQLVPMDSLMHVASASSLVIMSFIALVSIRSHYYTGEISWSVFNKLWVGLGLGTLVGVLLADYMPNSVLELIFGLFLLCIAGKMLFDLTLKRDGHFPKAWVNFLMTCFVGLWSGLLGIGGGALMVPYLNYCGLEYRKIAVITNLCTLVIGIIGSVMTMILGIENSVDLPYSTGYVYWPAVFLVTIPSIFVAPLGVKLNYMLPIKFLRYGLISVLFLIAVTVLKQSL